MRWFELIIVQSVLGMFFTACCLLLLRRFASQVGLLDQPNHRKIHLEAIPLVGGLAVYLSLFITHFISALFLGVESGFFLTLIYISSVVVFIGLIDDAKGVSPSLRFVVQMLACLLVIYFSGVKIDSFGELLWVGWDLKLMILAVPVTVFGVVGIINALNMTDGIDGLAAITFLIPFAFLMMLRSDFDVFLSMMTTICSVFVFLLFNFSKRFKVFLGDHGSLFLGFLLSWFLVYESQGDGAKILPVTALYLVAPALFDTIFVMLRRIFKGTSPFKADKTHIHHLFLAKGFSQSLTLLILSLIIMLFCTLGYVLMSMEVAESFQFYGFVGLSLVYYWLMARFWRTVNHD